MKRIATVLLAVVAVACSAEPADLLPIDKRMVDNLAEDGDCPALQDRFDNAADAGGDENLALMKYADNAMREVGCYD
jgi:hypothetical protein